MSFGQPIRILLIDDDPTGLSSVLDTLNDAYDVQRSGDPDQALALMRDGAFDAYLVDDDTRTRWGLSLLEQARTSGCDDPAILLVDGAASQRDAVAFEQGAAECLNKEKLSAELLRRTIRSAIRTRKKIGDLETLAYRDEVTGLANARTFKRQLRQAVEQAQREASLAAVLFVDLDRFKAVNDRYGHHAGDAVLAEVARRLCDRLRSTDRVGRLGGDEFGIVLQGVSRPTDAASVAVELIATIGNPYTVADRRIWIGASIGVSFCPIDGDDPDRLLALADAAMYHAKASGSDACSFYRPGMGEVPQPQAVALAR